MLTSDLFNKPVEENCKYGRYYCTTDKKYKCRQGPKQTRARESVEQGGAEEANPIDTVEMDVPLLIRALEYAREDAKDDMDLHKVVERMIAAAQNGEPLNMDDYNMLFGEQEVTEKIAYEPDEKGLQHMSLTMPQNAVVIDTPGDLDWYKLGHDIANLQQADPHEYGQSDSDMVIIPASDEEMKKLLVQLDRLGMRYKLIGGTHDQPEIHDEKFDEAKRKKKSKSKSSLMSKPAKRKYGGYFYPGYGYYGDSGDSGSGDGGGGGESRNNESRLYYKVAGTLNESLRKDFKMRKDRKGWFLPESASVKQKLDAERAFGEPIAEMNLLRPIKMKGPKNPVVVNQNGNKYKNPAKLIKFGK